MKYFDGAPLPETAELVYENLDRMRGVDVFLKAMPAASVRQLMLGPTEIGAKEYNQVLITEGLMDSKPLYLTANTSTLYTIPSANLKETGPLVLEVPAGMRGAPWGTTPAPGPSARDQPIQRCPARPLGQRRQARNVRSRSG